MNAARWIAITGLVAVLSGGFSARAGTVNYEMVPVGNAGNANDTTGYGGVAYEYSIGKYGVTISQYTAFLNAVDPGGTNPYGVFGYYGNLAGISFTSGAASGSKYAVMSGSGNKPITDMNWFAAARFANWMQNGQGSGSTETGAYTLVGGQNSGLAPAKNAGATVWIPTENEWYKAAYYDPTKGGTGGYWAYATKSDTAPGNTIGGSPNQANWYTGAGYSVTQSSVYSSSQNYLTDVGAYTGSASFYGTFDQSGLVYQWNDLDGSSGVARGVRGGFWGSINAIDLSSITRSANYANAGPAYTGFRLAGPASTPVPEIDPAGMCSVLALVTGALGLLERRRLKVA
jgi:hypothetical protein